MNVLEIARELKARYIVEGVVRKQSDVDHIAVRIFDLKKGGEMWEQLYEGNSKEIFDVRDKISEDVCAYLRDASSREQFIKTKETYIHDHPGDAAALADLAMLLISNDNFRSLGYFQQAIKYDSTNESYYIKAGVVADRLKDGGLARQMGSKGADVLRKKIQAHPDSLDLVASYCIALDVAGQVTTSEHLYDSLMRVYPKDGRLIFNAACNFSRQGKTEKALDALEKLSTFAPGKVRETRSDPDFDNIRMYPRYIKLMSGK